ncbi:C40 family peptidase [Cellulosimicrobium funkei]|uniref:C40 family peptidase n=1 Tax=Cellulosimicrobium funkei TaxID=264251 RepID=UPI000AB0224B|nr:C40 family peptidase [Cellulosimicrobium funkei]
MVTPPPGTGVGNGAQGQAAVAWARTKIGAPYVFGGTGPGYDCSGLTSRAWAAAGVDITRTSRSQYQRVQKISYDRLRPGDLIFYANDTSNPSTIRHVAMYTGGGMMIEARQPGSPVHEVAMRWADAMPYAGRP